MENASKALIIAGAILISILLISVGIIIMNAINDPVSRTSETAASQAVQIFNSQFTGYAGSDVDYNTTKQCITAVNSAKGEHSITLNGSIKTMSALTRNQTYDIDFEPDETGYYAICKIEPHTATP